MQRQYQNDIKRIEMKTSTNQCLKKFPVVQNDPKICFLFL